MSWLKIGEESSRRMQSTVQTLFQNSAKTTKIVYRAYPVLKKVQSLPIVESFAWFDKKDENINCF